MITFKQYFLIESMLEDIQVQDELEENILMLHEIEFKLSKLKDNPYAVNSKLFQNLFRRFYDVAHDIFDGVSDEMLNGFGQWKNMHQIGDANTWANMVFESFMESYGTPEQTVENIMAGGIIWGQLALSPEQIRQHVDPEKLQSDVEEDIYNSPEAYESAILQWLQEVKGYEGDDETEALEFYQDNDLSDEFTKYYLKNYFDASEYAEMYDIQPDPEDIKRAIAKELYPDYMNMFGSQLESIIEDIDETVERIESAQALDPNLGDTITGQPEEKLGQIGGKIYKGVSQMATAISLALNVNHVNGNILADYADISMDFMNKLDTYDTKQWEGEVDGIMRKY